MLWQYRTVAVSKLMLFPVFAHHLKLLLLPHKSTASSVKRGHENQACIFVASCWNALWQYRTVAVSKLMLFHAFAHHLKLLLLPHKSTAPSVREATKIKHAFSWPLAGMLWQ